MLRQTSGLPQLVVSVLVLANACHQGSSSAARAGACGPGKPGDPDECPVLCQQAFAHGGCPAGQFCDIEPSNQNDEPPVCRRIAGLNLDLDRSSGRASVCVEGNDGLFWTIAHRERAVQGGQRWRVWGGCVSPPLSSTHQAMCAREMPTAKVVSRVPCDDKS